MTEYQKKIASKQFVSNWSGKGYEKGECQKFWIDLICNVFGIQDFSSFLFFEEQITEKFNDRTITNFIDVYIPSTKVMIEQKSSDKDLRKPIVQSDKTVLTPYQQAKKYISNLPLSMHPRWVITCNFNSFLIYDMENPNSEPEEVLLSNLEKEYYRLSFITDTGNVHIRKELEVSKKAGDIIGEIYDSILAQYIDADNPSPETLKSLNMLCVRIVFCLYAEDAGIFGRKSMFGDYIKQYEPKDLRKALIELFTVLDQKPEARDPYLEDSLAVFPYVNGGLFTDSSIVIPQLTSEIKDLLVRKASDDFDWSEISPTIFGAIFESTLNPETRRSGGMHYTSIENIHKVIDPLFLDDLKAEFEEIKQYKVEKIRNDKLIEFQKKLGSLVFLDPACGSGNFLTETYLCLRRLENECLRIRFGGNSVLDVFENTIFVKIHQFYGIEINDFAVVVAKTALWIAESQMMQETAKILQRNLEFLPLKSYANIVEGNALRLNWEDIVSKDKLDFIMGNPPFVGLSLRTKEQQQDMNEIFSKNDRAGRLDYVAAWYKKASNYIDDTQIECSFVSTNSIVQGEQSPILWEDLFSNGIRINYAYRTFIWNSEASEKAHVHCVIIGFCKEEKKIKKLYEDKYVKEVEKINGYLVNADNVFIKLRSSANPDFPKLKQGNKPWDGGNLILSTSEKDELLSKYPEAKSLVKKYIGSQEFINNKERYCLWLKDVSPNAYRNIPEIVKRLEKVAEVRRLTKTIAVQAQAETPMLFSQIRQPDNDYILVPETSSEARRYIPIGFMDKDVIASNSTLVATDATIYHFGVLTSNVHMAWMRTVAGRLKSDYRYSPSVYNNFPWPEPTEEQRKTIETTAQAILDIRNKYPESSLADLYDSLTMPYELLQAHRENDKAVMQAYGFSTKMTESECVAELFKLYQQKVKEGNK